MLPDNRPLDEFSYHRYPECEFWVSTTPDPPMGTYESARRDGLNPRWVVVTDPVPDEKLLADVLSVFERRAGFWLTLGHVHDMTKPHGHPNAIRSACTQLVLGGWLVEQQAFMRLHEYTLRTDPPTPS